MRLVPACVFALVLTVGVPSIAAGRWSVHEAPVSVERGAQQRGGPASSPPKTAPEVIAPKHGADVPRQGNDPPCRPGPGCAQVALDGYVPPDYTPVLAVAPLTTAPRIWIQPLVPLAAVRRDGTFTGLVYLGSRSEGIGERFTLYVFGCKDASRFRDGDVITAVPKDCLISEPVTVRRTK